MPVTTTFELFDSDLLMEPVRIEELCGRGDQWRRTFDPPRNETGELFMPPV
jgi:hypothetical protein